MRPTYRYVEIGVHQSSTPGAANDLDSFPRPYKSSDHVIAGVTHFGLPVPIMVLVQEEGVDFPFSTRFHTAIADVVPKRRQFYIERTYVASTATNAAVGEPILDIPPDETPLFVKPMFNPLVEQFAAARRDRVLGAGRATADAPGYWAEFIPAETYTDFSCRLLTEIQRHMFETPDEGMTWTLWTQTEVLGYVNQRIYRFLLATGLLRTRTTISVAAGDTSVPLPTDLIEIRRVAWDGVGLPRVDAFQTDHGVVGWEATTGTPYSYFEEPLPPLAVRLVPTPSVDGTIDLLYVALPTAIGSVCVRLPLPSCYTPYIKYGVMADMFGKQGEANDPQRAAYCEGRFVEGIEVAKMMLGAKA